MPHCSDCLNAGTPRSRKKYMLLKMEFLVIFVVDTDVSIFALYRIEY